jgi:hypothetical protein
MDRNTIAEQKASQSRGTISDLSQHKGPDRTSPAKLKKEASKQAEKKGEEKEVEEGVAEKGGAAKVQQ